MHDARCSTFDVRCTIIITLLLLLQYKQRLLNFYAFPSQSTDWPTATAQPLFPRGIFARPILVLRLCLCVCMVLFVYLFICLSVYLSVVITASLFPLSPSHFSLLNSFLFDSSRVQSKTRLPFGFTSTSIHSKWTRTRIRIRIHSLVLRSSL